MNVLSISGNLGRDAEVRQFEDNFLIKFSIAHNYRQGNEEKTLWVNCEMWRQGSQAAEKSASVLTKGRKIGVVGQLLDDSYEKDSQRIKAVKVKVDRFYLMDSPNQNGQTEQRAETPAKQKTEADYIPF